MHNMRGKVLYIGAGNPLSPSSGMDVVLREHIQELTQLSGIELTGITVQPGVAGASSAQPDVPWKNFKHFIGDLQSEAGGISRILKKLALILFGSAPLSAYAFCSKAARQHIASELNRAYDVVIIDHMMTICNVPFWQLLNSKAKIVFIAHDVTPHFLMEAARLQKHLIKTLFFMVEALKSWIVECAIINKAAMTVFLSQWDLEQYHWMPSLKATSLCPILTQRHVPDANRGMAKPEVVFIGSPAFLPNKAALEWIIHDLSPHLLAVDPAISIALVGRGTAALDERGQANIKHMGFVSDEELAVLLRDCLAVISPVVHGSGIKIKVLEAVMAGSPVLATAESLRGFEFLDIQPEIALDNADAAAQTIARLKQYPEQQVAARQHVSNKWKAYTNEYKNKLGMLITGLINSHG